MFSTLTLLAMIAGEPAWAEPLAPPVEERARGGRKVSRSGTRSSSRGGKKNDKGSKGGGNTRTGPRGGNNNGGSAPKADPPKRTGGPVSPPQRSTPRPTDTRKPDPPSRPTPSRPDTRPVSPSGTRPRPTPTAPTTNPNRPTSPPGRPVDRNPRPGATTPMGRPSQRINPVTTPSAPLVDRTPRAPLPQDRFRSPGPPTVSARPYDPREARGAVRRSTPLNDARYYRPEPGYVRTHPDAAPPPSHGAYRGYYTGYYCHPYYRSWYYTSATVWFHFSVYPWTPGWIPPSRWGYAWVPGYWYFGWWHPGYWRPTIVIPVGYIFVPGWWATETVYVEGYYRRSQREGWRWIDGRYLDDGTYVRGHWVPMGDHPEGYVWVPGFWDGEHWLEGFWRPEYRSGFRWLDGYYDADGVFHAGYWEPLREEPGMVWVPGWFDGTAWVEGYWLPAEEVDRADPEDWKPELPVAEEPVELDEDAPLALPVEIAPEDGPDDDAVDDAAED